MSGLPLGVLKLFGGQQANRKPFTPVWPRGVVECGRRGLCAHWYLARQNIHCLGT